MLKEFVGHVIEMMTDDRAVKLSHSPAGVEVIDVDHVMIGIQRFGICQPCHVGVRADEAPTWHDPRPEYPLNAAFQYTFVGAGSRPTDL